METMKEKIQPVALEITFDKKEDILGLADDKKYKKFIIEETYKIIKECISSNPDKIQLFNIVNFGFIISINKDDIKNCLNTVLRYYESIEDYDKCMEINNLFNQI